MLAAVSGRGQPAAQEDKAAVFRAEYLELVVLHATVVDRNGRFVTNLPREVFTVLRSGIRRESKTLERGRSSFDGIDCQQPLDHHAR